MGYRSDVRIAIIKEVYMDALIKENFPEIFIENEPDIIDGNRYYSFDDIKWYDDFPDIAECMKFLNNLPEEDWGFIKIGENDDDVESFGSPWDFDMYVETSIITPID